MSLYSLENEAFASLVKYGSVVLLKMSLMIVPTAFRRFSGNSFATEEDLVAAGITDKEKIKRKLATPDEEVERVRRAHLNDMENIIPFLLISLLYISTNPDPHLATWLFKIFTASRIVHTVVYLGKVRQPARFLAFTGGLCVNFTMLFFTLRHVW